jgi:hypothetical protein
MGYISILILTTMGVYLLGERILSVPDTAHPYLWRWWESWLVLGTIVTIVLIAITSGGMSSPLPWVAASVCAVLGLLFALALIVSQPAEHHPSHLIKQRKPAH